MPYGSGCLSLRKKRKKTEILCCSSQDAATSYTRILAQCSFFVPQDLNLYVHISKDLGCGYPEYPRLWYDMLGVQECWVLLLGEGTVFSPGQTPV